MFSKFICTFLWSSWKRSPFVSPLSHRLRILIRLIARILRHPFPLLLLGHTMLIKPIMHIIWLRWLSITWYPSTSISFLLNYLLWSMINLWFCLHTVFCLINGVFALTKSLIDSSVPIQISLWIRIDNIIATST